MEYYKAYEKRYQAVFDADVELWGNSEKDAILAETIRKWVEDNELRGKRVIEFACGEGSCGILLSELGVIYCGVDIAPTAVKKAKERLRRFHMIVTDGDRKHYLKNAYSCLNDHAPMLFFRESYSGEAEINRGESFADFQKLTDSDYETPQKRTVNGREVYIPLLPARARSKEGYLTELEAAGFSVETFGRSKENGAILCSVDIYVRKE